MKCRTLQRWCRPKAILIVADLSTHPANIREAITRVQMPGVEILLVHVSGRDSVGPIAGRTRPFLLTKGTVRDCLQPSEATGRGLLWAEVFSRVNVLKSALVEEIPALADALKVDLVVLAALDSGFASIRAVRFIEETLMTFLRVPLCIIGRHSDRKPWSENGIRRVLLPVSLPSDVRLRLRFACHLAESHHARLTVLHAFGSRRESVHPWERTPVAVEAQLPISELRRDGILCPIEVTVAEGDPATAIVKFDAIRKHDLIIMGTPGLADPAPRYGNGVVQTVISEAGCPVVVLGRSIDPASAFVGAVTPLSLA